jgi:hypothetical protein
LKVDKNPYLLDGESPEAAVRRYQNLAFNGLHSPAGRTVAKECVALGVSYTVLETLLCRTYARLELVSKRIDIMLGVKPVGPKAIKELTWIWEAAKLADINADQTSIVFGIEDPTKPPKDVLPSFDILLRYHNGMPETERLLRERLGLSIHRIHDHKIVARREALGYLAFLLHPHFTDKAPHDELVAKLIWSTIKIHVESDDIQHYRESYEKRVAT